MKYLLYSTFSILILTACSINSPEQQLIDQFNTKYEWYGNEEFISIGEIAQSIENYLLTNGYLTDVSQDSYFQLLLALDSAKIKINYTDMLRKVPSWTEITGPNATATIFFGSNKIVEENPDMSSDHPVRTITKLTNEILEKNDLGDLELLEQLIYSIPEHEFVKLHYHMVPIAVICIIVQGNAK